MQSSISIARATATLPRSWTKNGTKINSNVSEARFNKRQEGANKTRLILQKYLQRGIEPTNEVLDSLDPTNLSYEGTISASSSCAGSLSSAIILEPHQPIPPSSSKQSKRKSKQNENDSQRCKLIRKQTKRQSILPSFFEPNWIGTSPEPKLSVSNPTRIPTQLTVEALSAHNHPVKLFLNPTGSRPMIKKSISFQTLPIIRIIKPIPECLDDHSNPSSRDPFYYDEVLKKIEREEIHQSLTDLKKSKNEGIDEEKKRNRSGSQDSLGSGSVTAWFAKQYQD
ncbi:hypothetical protein DFH28DRAFT_891691 [Melampsora americana]|nr:hypothetical protein DFH28DRAFT_891691 [Melampsora americana]